MKVLFKILLGFILLFVPCFIDEAAAQPPPLPPVNIPIDGGLGVLILAGMAYGGKKLYDNRTEDEITV